MALKPLTGDELEKVRKLKGESDSVSIPYEDVLEVGFVLKFGFEAYWAIHPEKDRSRGIGIQEMMRLLMASRKLDAKATYDATQASFIGAISSNSKNPSNTLTKLTKGMIKEMKAN